MIAKRRTEIKVYIEIGEKRTFAGAIDWPGWCRRGRDEQSALQTLFDYGPRYAQILSAAQIEFQAPTDITTFAVIERLEGNAMTDFGVPDITPASDLKPMDEAEFQRCQTLLRAYWQAFDEVMRQASGKKLRTGPRGGGRDLAGIARHVIGGDVSYLARLGWRHKKSDGQNLDEEFGRTRQAVLAALAAAMRGETPQRGPRGGVIWTPRYFVRRLAWHVLDHLWEIEDRAI